MAVPSPTEISAQNILKESKNLRPFGDVTMPELGTFIELQAPDMAVADALARLLKSQAETNKETQSIVVDDTHKVFASEDLVAKARAAILGRAPE